MEDLQISAHLHDGLVQYQSAHVTCQEAFQIAVQCMKAEYPTKKVCLEHQKVIVLAMKYIANRGVMEESEKFQGMAPELLSKEQKKLRADRRRVSNGALSKFKRIVAAAYDGITPSMFDDENVTHSNEDYDESAPTAVTTTPQLSTPQTPTPAPTPELSVPTHALTRASSRTTPEQTMPPRRSTRQKVPVVVFQCEDSMTQHKKLNTTNTGGSIPAKLMPVKVIDLTNGVYEDMELLKREYEYDRLSKAQTLALMDGILRKCNEVQGVVRGLSLPRWDACRSMSVDSVDSSDVSCCSLDDLSTVPDDDMPSNPPFSPVQLDEMDESESMEEDGDGGD